MNYLEKMLFKTSSIKIAKSDAPFWYTSGTIGPYFINTHFLYGNEKEANDLLKFIDGNKENKDNKENKKKFINLLNDKVITFYKINSQFKKIMDIFYSQIKKIKEFHECEYISGGERRDWFFSPIISYLSGKKLLFIFKDLKVFDIEKQIFDLKKAKICHICDLITQASSHKRSWIPAIESINGEIIFNASIVDRDEGGIKFLENSKIKNLSIVTINKIFLNNLINNKIINQKQSDQIEEFKKNPIDYGKKFISKNPEFLKESLYTDSLKQKVVKCIKENPYELDFSKLLDKNLLKEIIQ